MVLQETWLKSGTIRENIAYGKPDASMEEIIKAAKEAHADSFIRKMPQGYETRLSAKMEEIFHRDRNSFCVLPESCCACLLC